MAGTVTFLPSAMTPLNYSGCADTADACLEDGSYSVTCDGGSWQGEVSWSIVDASGTVLLEGGAPYSGALVLGETNDVLGCTDRCGELRSRRDH